MNPAKAKPLLYEDYVVSVMDISQIYFQRNFVHKYFIPNTSYLRKKEIVSDLPHFSLESLQFLFFSLDMMYLV